MALSTILAERTRQAAAWALAALTLTLPACETDGHFTLLGYSTAPNYDPTIRTVYVPIFENRTFRRGLEFELTRAVIRQIEQQTPFKVVHDCNKADTELLGTIVMRNKAILNRNQLNEVREAETILLVEVLWRDRRSGEILSGPGRRLGDPMPPAMPVLTATSEPVAQLADAEAPKPPQDAPAGEVLAKPVPVLVSSVATFIPELGPTIATAEKINVERLAVQIVSMMEQPW